MLDVVKWREHQAKQSMSEKPKAKRNPGMFKKGQSGNPGGRPKGFRGMAKYIRTQTSDGEELADFALKVFRNEEKCYTHAHQWDALKWLADHGFGRAPQTVDLNVNEGAELPDLPDLSALDPKQLGELDTLIAALVEQAKGSSPVH